MEAAIADLALAVVGTPGDPPHPAAAAAAPLGPRGTDRAERFARRAAPVHHLHHPAAATSGGVVPGPATRAEPGPVCQGQLRVAPPATGTSWLWQVRAQGLELPHQLSDHGRRPDQQGGGARPERFCQHRQSGHTAALRGIRKGPGPSAFANTDRAFALGAAAATAEWAAAAPSPGQASATRDMTRSSQDGWRVGLTPPGPPWPGGDGCPAPPPACSSSWPGPSWAPPGPAPRDLQG